MIILLYGLYNDSLSLNSFCFITNYFYASASMTMLLFYKFSCSKAGEQPVAKDKSYIDKSP